MVRMVGLLLAVVMAGGAAASNVKDFGAVGDGVANDTKAIQAAIDAGGLVHFPKGTYLTGTIYLKSNGGLDLSPEATIRAIVDPTQYNSPDVCVQNHGAEVASKAHLIMAIEQTNIVIRGGGTIDGNAEKIFEQYKGEYTHVGMGGIRLKKNPDWQLSQMIALYECEKVRLQDLTLRNSCFWNCHLFGCEQVQVRGLNIKSDPEIAGDDGLDIDCCRHVTVSDCIIDVGDDGITLRAAAGTKLKRKRPCEYVTVANCSVRSAYAHAIRVGVGTGLIRHCTFSNLVMENTRCAIHMNPLYDEGGTGVEMDDISFSDIHATAKMFLFLTLDYKWVGKNRFRGVMENIRFTNVSGEAKLPVTIKGNGLGTLRNVVWKDSTVRFTDPSVLTDADKRFYMFDPAKPLGDNIQIDKADNVVIRDVTVLDGPSARARLRALAEDPATFEQAVAEGLKSEDSVVRRWTLCQLWKKDPARAKAVGKELADGADPALRTFLFAIGAIDNKTDFAFYRDNVARSESPNDDHDYAPAGEVKIPVEGWKLAFDPKNAGHKAKTPWFDPAFDDDSWETAHVKAHWESQGFPEYDGIAWYRVRFVAPEKPAEGKSFELCFGGVDEDAWVWLNGTYVGQRVEGEAGWDKPFRFDVEREIKWGAENVLAVRVYDSRFGGGIWKPVRLEVLK